MKVIKRIIFLVLVLAAQLGFSQDALTDLQSEIVGNWEWLRTEPSDGATLLTPDLCSCTKTIEIQSAGTYTYLEGNIIIYQGDFTLLMSGAGPSKETYFFMGNHLNLGLELTDNDELHLGSLSTCKGIMVFKRIVK